MTWNPTLFIFGEDESCNIGEEITWSCNSQQPKIDDTVYLIRVGQEPRGIVARGVVTQESFDESDFRDLAQQKRKIRFRFTDVRMDQSEGSLPLLVLQHAFPEQQWSPQSSGIAIKPDYETELSQLWTANKGKHSLDIALRWCYDNKDSNDAWFQKYRATCERAQHLHASGEVLDDDLRLLWHSREKEHPIASVRSNGLSGSEVEKNRSLLKELTLDILRDPSPAKYDTVCRQWESWKEQGLFAAVYRAQINRFFAAANPTDFICAADNKFPEKFGKQLTQAFHIPLDVKGSWGQASKNIIDEVTPLIAEDWNPLKRNIAFWNLYQKTKKITDDELEVAAPENTMTTETPIGTNTILYGPPGTGKTYCVIERAVKAAKPELHDCTDREILKAEYDILLSAKRIRFVTFHQSFSYEEFIEGLQAKSDDGQISYDVKPGIFKQICNDAERGTTTAGSPLAMAIEQFKLQLELENRMTLTTKKGNSFGVEFHGNTTFRAFPEGTTNENLGKGYPVSIEHIWNEYQGINQERIYNPSYVKAILHHLIETYDVPAFDAVTASAPEPFVLVIDEINRGNISKIFGELITLIEPSKRAGQKEALSVQLPYSGETFSVPSNLHIIGTMNTADRSLATMDTALRRRFDYIEMMPDYTPLNGMVVKGINIADILRTLNDRIEYLYDREHSLGHAFFMPIAHKESDNDKFDELASIFKKKILPLLQEYFFEDWEKICLILGDNQKTDTQLQFVTQQAFNTQQLFGASYAADQYADDRKVFVINDHAFSTPEAYLQITTGSSPTSDNQ
ncbi:McrB family protein [Endozoicomonas ascidiicola]|uniref:McrB family protein n=1 Tax=Endozoicomonas ascidiicola TaxID=1698521 RepID=UPI0012FA67F7|nr:AAA family ATPase [Endozoicomonas ascidiicola]